MVTTTGAPPKQKPPSPPVPPSCGVAAAAAKYDSVWMGGAPDWAALQVALVGVADNGVGLEGALAMAEKELDHYRTGLRDQWNVHGLYANDGYGVDGQPWCTAHYGFHMPLWFIPFAMTGQLYSAVDQSLSFEPKVPCSYAVPVLTAGAVGTLSCAKGTGAGGASPSFTLLVTAGSLELHSLAASGVRCPSSKLTAPLNPGDSVSWP